MKYFLRDPKNLRFIGIIAFAIALLIVLSVYLVTRLGDANTNNRLQQNALSAESVIFQKTPFNTV